MTQTSPPAPHSGAERRRSVDRLPLLRATGAGGSVVTLSVVVVGYNGRDLLARCLESVLADAATWTSS